MQNNSGSASKHCFRATGVTGISTLGDVNGYAVHIEHKLKINTYSFGVLNVVTVYGKIMNDPNWVSLDTVTGNSTKTIDISAVDFVKYDITTSDGTGDVYASAFI